LERTVSKSLAIALFLALLAVGAVFGLARDLYSRQRATLSGVVVNVEDMRQTVKSATMNTPSIKARLDDGTLINVAAKQTRGIKNGDTIDVTEMVMPWGQVWYKLKAE
jgi:hypothetical protein